MTKGNSGKQLTQAELARELGVTRQMVGKYVKAGLPVIRGRITLAKAKRWIEKNIESRKGSSSDLTEVRIRGIEASAILKELEIRQRQGELVETEDVRESWSKIIITVQDRLMQIAGKLAPRVIAAGSAQAAEEMIEAEITQALTTLSEFQLNAA